MKRDNPPLGENFWTQKDAEAFVKNALERAKWLCRLHLEDDVYVDFHFESVAEGHPAGFVFAVQVKGSQQGQKNRLKTRMKCEHLKYYRDKARLPVFVILVDLVARDAHWLFAQQYSRDCPNKEAIGRQETFTVEFDPADSFNDLERFREALRNADRYMRELYPGSQSAAALARETELQQLDPDIKVKASFDDGCEVLRFKTEKQLNYTFHGLDAEAFRSFQAMLDHGEDFEASAKITPPDSPLFKRLMKGKSGRFRFTPDRPDGCLQIISVTPGELIQINGKWRVGKRSIRFQGELEKSPLQVELRIENWLEGEHATISFDTPISLLEWEGQSVVRLASFDQIRSLISALANREELVIKYFLHGAKVGELHGFADKGNTANAGINRVSRIIDWLARARDVALHYGADVVLPEWAQISPEMESAVDALHDLANARPREETISGLRFTVLASPDIAFPPENSSGVSGAMRLIGSASFNFLGREVTVPEVEQILANMRLLSTAITPTAKEFVFEGQEGAVLTRRKIAA